MPNNPATVLIPGIRVQGLGDVHGAVGREAIRLTPGALGQHLRHFADWRTGWLADDDRVVSSVVGVVMDAYPQLLRERGATGWSAETLAAIARRASREKLDEIRRGWTTAVLVRQLSKFLADPRNAGSDLALGRRVLAGLQSRGAG